MSQLAQQEEHHLAVNVRDTEAAQAALGKAGIAASLNNHDSLIITDEDAIRHPDNIATLLVQAGCPPVALVVERGDLESYFLKLVGMKGKNGDE